MKNVLRFTLAALALAIVATTTYAAVSSPSRWEFVNVKFITSAAANPNGGIVDSTVARRVGALGASSVLDTTDAISLEGFNLPTSAHTGIATDTSQVWMVLHVYDATGTDDDCESGADSLWAALQVSADGQTWMSTCSVAGASVSTGTNPITSRNDQVTSGAFRSALSLNGAALANGKPSWMFKYRYRGINAFSTIDAENSWVWPYVRFILALPDAKGYKVSARVLFNSGKQ